MRRTSSRQRRTAVLFCAYLYLLSMCVMRPSGINLALLHHSHFTLFAVLPLRVATFKMCLLSKRVAFIFITFLHFLADDHLFGSLTKCLEITASIQFH